MSSVDTLRNDIIDKLFTITSKEYLSAIYELLSHSKAGTEAVKLTPEQILMLQLSEHDIAAGRLISQDEVDKDDLEWLKEQ